MSYLVNVELHISASRAAVFDRLSDHARYKEFPGISESELVSKGHRDDNGTDAVRMIRTSSGVRFVEEIGEFERPHFFKYRILQCTLPMNHIGGEIRLSEQDGVTHVVWRSEFESRIPLLGPVARRLAANGFVTILEAVKRDVE